MCNKTSDIWYLTRDILAWTWKTRSKLSVLRLRKSGTEWRCLRHYHNLHHGCLATGASIAFWSITVYIEHVIIILAKFLICRTNFRLKCQEGFFWLLSDFIHSFLYILNLKIFCSLILYSVITVGDYLFFCKYTVSRLLI